MMKLTLTIILIFVFFNAKAQHAPVANAPSLSAASVNLTYPLGGETFNAGQIANITWAEPIDVANIRLEVYTADYEWMEIWPFAIPASTRSFEFTIPTNAWTWNGYIIRISDYDNASVNDESAAFTVIGHNIVLSDTEFSNGNFGNYTVVDQLGVQEWHANYGPYARIYGNVGGAQDNDDWLISPLIDLTQTTDNVLEFDAYYNYIGPDLTLLYSTNYEGDVAAATWISLPFDKPYTNSVWGVVLVDISNITGSVHFGFNYTSGTTTGAAEWRISYVWISGIESATPTPDTNLSPELIIKPNPFQNNMNIFCSDPISSVKIINSIGQSIKMVYGNHHSQMIIPTDELTEGIYIVKVTKTNGNTIVKKVMKK